MQKKFYLLLTAVMVCCIVIFTASGCQSSNDEPETDAKAEEQPAAEEQAADMEPAGIPQVSGDTLTTETGLKYIEVVEGQGEKAGEGKRVSVHYTGWLKDGKMFDSSKGREPFVLDLGTGAVIKGWDEGLMGMAVGGKRILIIPPELGYGNRPVRNIIPANSTLIFEVEMLDITDPPPPPEMPEYSEKDLKETESGLKYIILKEGTGKTPQAGQNVKVHYSGWFTDGKLFDSSVERGMPFSFPLGAGRVIKGWDEGVALMKEGEKRLLVIPPELAYGSSGRPGIPPNSTLVFEIDLLEVPE